MKKYKAEKRFVICVNNKGYAASLEVRKIYRVITDTRADKHQLIRVIDESGEDYLYPADYFVPIELSETLEKTLLIAT